MAMSSGAFNTYLDDTESMREDLFDTLTMISPTDTVLLTDLPKDVAKNTFIEWTNYSLSTYNSNSQVEGFDASFTTPSARTRQGNRTQIFGNTFKVAGSIEAANQAGIASEYSFRLQEAMRVQGTDIEKALTQGTSASGNSATARTLAGVRAYITSVSATGSSTAAFIEDVFNNLCESIYTNGGTPQVCYCSPKLKRVVAAYSTPNQRTLARAQEGFLAAFADVYQGEFGPVELRLDRWLAYSKQADYEVALFIDRKYWRVSLYRRTFEKKLPDNGDFTAGLVVTELSLKSLAESANGKFLASST